MFGGNAKTHFQMLGRGDNPTGYMMSPFGDERWDIDDQEKMRKIRQRTKTTQPSGATKAEQCHSEGNQLQSCRSLPQQSAEAVPGHAYQELQYITLADARSHSHELPPPTRSFQYKLEDGNQPKKYGTMNGLQDETVNRRYVCDSCRLAQAQKRENTNWRTAPDVPITIPGQNHYKPLGNSGTSPNPTFPPRERNIYIPLS